MPHEAAARKASPERGPAGAGANRVQGESPAIDTVAVTSNRRRPVVAVVAASLDILGGQGVQARTLMQRLRAESYEVVFVPINPPLPRWLGWVRRVPYLRTIVNELHYLSLLPSIRAADVVHIYSASYFSFLLGPVPALIAARVLKKHAVLNYHSGEADDHLARWGMLVHPWLRLASEIVVPSAYLQAVFVRHGYQARVVANTVEASSFRFRERSVLHPRLLSARNLEPHYRVDVVIRAFALLKERLPDATLVVAGSGSEEGRLRRLAESLGVRDIAFTGRFSPADAPALYDAADIFVNASVVDNQPVSILEAFAAGLPVVSTGTGDIPAMLLGGAAGLLVGQKDPNAIAEAVTSLVTNSALALRLAQRARESLCRFSWESVGEQWRGIYGGAQA